MLYSGVRRKSSVWKLHIWGARDRNQSRLGTFNDEKQGNRATLAPSSGHMSSQVLQTFPGGCQEDCGCRQEGWASGSGEIPQPTLHLDPFKTGLPMLQTHHRFELVPGLWDRALGSLTNSEPQTQIPSGGVCFCQPSLGSSVRITQSRAPGQDAMNPDFLYGQGWTRMSDLSAGRK